MTHPERALIRRARCTDADALVRLWSVMYEDDNAPTASPWKTAAHSWVAAHAHDEAHLVLVADTAGQVVATAIGSVQGGAPNPFSPSGQLVRLTSVVTLREHRNRGHATALVQEVISWARTLGADRVDLNASPAGQLVYEGLGFSRGRFPQMWLML